ncbi:hypothetical protein DH2020_049547 [Rehmannia glutinosa]|uniref:GH16 domain-containing protein n=1 Tax=Rehmannia glutinosa TaxID=99300 RepID=A0ABR0U397_REHGL
MGSLYLSLCVIFLFLASNCSSSNKADVIPFDKNYIPLWGIDHVSILDQGIQVQIRIDPTSGGGFRSRQAYGSGFFRISLKIPTNAKGILATFYLTSVEDNTPGGGNHDELDFEFLGHDGPPYILNTNVFAQDSGHREQQFNLWFDPTLDFHDYEILWNKKQIVFFIDGIPIRVFKNNELIGAKYPKIPMYIHGSLWNASEWLGPTDWSRGPFVANYRGFEINGCPYNESSNPQDCESLQYPWNAPNNWNLTTEQQNIYKEIKNRFIVYDYCESESAKNFPECRIGS